jgi:hypothetical protein
MVEPLLNYWNQSIIYWPSASQHTARTINEATRQQRQYAGLRERRAAT